MEATTKRNREANQAANFLASLDGLSQHEAFENARLDARLYKWSDETLETVISGICAAGLEVR